MRRGIVLGVATLALVLALPALEVNAVCEPPPPPDSDGGIRAMRATQFIVWGTIDPDVPLDAHAQHSFVLRVRGYFAGVGPARIEVADHGDGDLAPEALIAGSAIDTSEAFVDRFGGQDAVVFTRRENAPYTGQYATNVCTYTAYGDAAVSDIMPLLRREFGAPQPPALATSGPASAAPLALAAALLLAAGGALRWASRPAC